MRPLRNSATHAGVTPKLFRCCSRGRLAGRRSCLGSRRTSTRWSRRRWRRRHAGLRIVSINHRTSDIDSLPSPNDLTIRPLLGGVEQNSEAVVGCVLHHYRSHLRQNARRYFILLILIFIRCILPGPVKLLLLQLNRLNKWSTRSFRGGGIQLRLQTLKLFVHVGQFGLPGLELFVECAEIALPFVATGKCTGDVDGRDLTTGSDWWFCRGR